MHNSRVVHPGEAELSRFADGEMDAASIEKIRIHLETCPDCRNGAQEIKAASGAYQQYHRESLKPGLPHPPRAWADLQSLIDATENGTVVRALPRRRRQLWRPVSAIAAALILAVALTFAVLRLKHPEPVSAAELLHRAISAEHQAPRPNRLRIRTRRQTFLRPAVLKGAGAGPANPAALIALFAAAHYDWHDPLSAAAFAQWREQLAKRTDQVQFDAGTPQSLYTVRTYTPDGSLAQAELTLRSRDLKALTLVLSFRENERVEISDAGDQPLESTGKPLPASETPQLKPKAPVQPPPHAVLQVMAALHKIGADLGEAVELTIDRQTVVVTGTALDSVRSMQLEQLLSTIPGVAVRFERANPATAIATGGSDEQLRASPRRLAPDFERACGGPAECERLADQVLQLGDRIMARAHALRNLAQWFPHDAEQRLDADGSAVLNSLRRDHADVSASAAHELSALVLPVLARLEPQARSASDSVQIDSDWHIAANQLLAAASEADRSLTGLFAGADISSRAAELPSHTAAAVSRFTAIADAFHNLGGGR